MPDTKKKRVPSARSVEAHHPVSGLSRAAARDRYQHRRKAHGVKTRTDLQGEVDRLRQELEVAAKALETLACMVAVVTGPMPTREELRLAWEHADSSCTRARKAANP